MKTALDHHCVQRPYGDATFAGVTRAYPYGYRTGRSSPGRCCPHGAEPCRAGVLQSSPPPSTQAESMTRFGTVVLLCRRGPTLGTFTSSLRVAGSIGFTLRRYPRSLITARIDDEDGENTGTSPATSAFGRQPYAGRRMTGSNGIPGVRAMAGLDTRTFAGLDRPADCSAAALPAQ